MKFHIRCLPAILSGAGKPLFVRLFFKCLHAVIAARNRSVRFLVERPRDLNLASGSAEANVHIGAISHPDTVRIDLMDNKTKCLTFRWPVALTLPEAMFPLRAAPSSIAGSFNNLTSDIGRPREQLPQAAE